MIEVRKAVLADVEQVFELVNHYANEGLMLPRTKDSLVLNLQSIFVAEEAGEILGIASLAILGHDLAEIRSLGVKDTAMGRGIGKMLVERVVEETKLIGIPKLISLTYQVVFFEKCGFEVIQKTEMPQKVWTDCIHCPKFPSCDEIAMAIQTA
ncbi:N-acetyltransferase [Domibacillus enclensis]|uniref:GNAT family N-acetyltransferase n=1 Tax=Domibacillus enclensis TaxID=1017273 RepID=A0A1N6WNX6_9BACI|nr:N-acetyltransferase [Domibacillus enclensis]OXS77995.1 GNAT family N-acetyltransferase [Domibacillus enclensis]SIQ91712.1 N-acetylglutamate synthase [Domibacillus enclensis]